MSKSIAGSRLEKQTKTYIKEFSRISYNRTITLDLLAIATLDWAEIVHLAVFLSNKFVKCQNSTLFNNFDI